MMNQEEDQMFLLSQPNPSLFYSSTTTPLLQGEEESRSSRSRRRKKNKIEANDEVSFRKRKLSDEQVRQLEINFGNEHKLESERKDKIASELSLDPRQVAVWFQNRRVRWKTKKLEEEYSKLQMIHEGVVLEKCRLESEVMKLKEEILKAENEKKKISERRNDEGVHSSGSPSSSSGFSIDAADSSILIQEFGGGFDNFFYVPEENNYNNVYGMEWVDNLYGL